MSSILYYCSYLGIALFCMTGLLGQMGTILLGWDKDQNHGAGLPLVAHSIAKVC